EVLVAAQLDLRKLERQHAHDCEALEGLRRHDDAVESEATIEELRFELCGRCLELREADRIAGVLGEHRLRPLARNRKRALDLETLHGEARAVAGLRVN